VVDLMATHPEVAAANPGGRSSCIGGAPVPSIIFRGS
jgi:hypothetical protein